MKSEISLQVPLSKASETIPQTPIILPDTQEPVLIELQGSFVLTSNDGSSVSQSQVSGTTMGSLDMSDPSKPTLTVGYHLLTGKIANVHPPLALVRQRKEQEQEQEQEQDEFVTNHEDRQLSIVNIIRRKIIFSRRPEPISISE